MNKCHFVVGVAAFLLGLGSLSPKAIACSNSAMEITAESRQSRTFRTTKQQQSQTLQLPRPQVDEANVILPRQSDSRCPSLTVEKTALFQPILPVDDSISTIAKNPSVWVYVPSSNALRAEFSVTSLDGELTYQQEIDLGAGLINIQLPSHVLTSNQIYYWDLILVMDQFDYSGNLYAFGEIHQQTPSQIVLSKDRETLDTLAELLADDRNFLSLEPTTAKSLAFLLKQQRNSETIAQVETQLREHFLSVYQDYGVAQRNSGKNNLHEQKILELAQLSAFFGLWADTANFIAQIRTERPDIWQATLPTLLYQDSSNLDSDTRELISYRLETLKEISEVTAFF